jgi:hypothetical protein
MNKQNYLENNTIIDFINWLTPRISGERKFYHQYLNSRNNTIWKCNSIYNAYENYSWPFNCSLPDNGKNNGSSYNDSEKVLMVIGERLKQSLKRQDREGLLAYCLSILEWGGVIRSNKLRLQGMGKNIVPYFENTVIKLNPKNANTRNDFSDVIMNSGFTKIYSLLIDDFIIYDSRVGAALGLLVKQYLTDRSINYIPDVLDFAYGNARPTKSDAGKINRRNPSNNIYKFKALNNDDQKHIKNNICANWLLKKLSEQSKFRLAANPIRALESALFMIGYSVREDLEK